MSDTKKLAMTEVQKGENNISLLDFLASNREKLELILSGDRKSSPLLNKITGKRKTRTVFLAEKLQFIMNEYCIKHEIQIADFCETAIVHYLTAQGYTAEIKEILSSSQHQNETI
jgi:hypothetical protein